MIEFYPKGTKWSEQDILSLKEDYISSMSNNDLEIRYKREYETIRSKAKSMGFVGRKGYGDIWTELELINLEQDYMSFMPKKEMCSKYNRTWSSIAWKVSQLGYKRGMPKEVQRKNTLLTKDEMVTLYSNGLSAIEIGKLANISKSCVLVHLNNRGRVRRSLSEAGRYYTLNEHYFDEINTEKSSYLYGLLMADGCNYEPDGKICITLQERDKEILERFNKEIGSNRPLQFVKASLRKNGIDYTQNYYSLNICSKHMSKMLAKHGCVQAKSLITTFPEWLDPKLYNHFIRGYFCGDGCISMCSKHKGHGWQITGTSKLLLRIQEIMIKELGLRKTVLNRPKNNKAVTLRYGGRLIVNKIMEWLYQDATIYLQRKYDKWQSIKEVDPNNRFYGKGKKYGKKVIDTSTGLIYHSVQNMIMDLNLPKYPIKDRMCGKTKNTTPLLYLTDFIQQNPNHPISQQYTNTQPLKQTA